MNIRREVLHGARIPPWHRIAYRDFVLDCAIAYPIGLHLVVKLCRRVWEWSYRYTPSRQDRLHSKSRIEGYRYGYDCGYEHGKDDGRKLAEAARLGWDAFFQNIKRG